MTREQRKLQYNKFKSHAGFMVAIATGVWERGTNFGATLTVLYELPDQNKRLITRACRTNGIVIVNDIRLLQESKSVRNTRSTTSMSTQKSDRLNLVASVGPVTQKKVK